MRLPRALVPAGAVFALTLLSGCAPDYGGARCNAIRLSTDPATLPLGARGPVTNLRLSDPVITGTPELACCVHAFYPERANCSTIDCDALASRLTVALVQGDFLNEPCGRQSNPFGIPEGIGTCSVYLEGDTIVGVRAFCFD